MKLKAMAALAVLFSALSVAGCGDESVTEIGEVTTKWNPLSPDHTINIEGFDDPKVEGVTCYVSKAQTGGWSSTVGLEEDTSDASIACRQTGPIRIREEFDNGERVFSERRSVLFKKLQVTRFWDGERNVLIYLTYSDRLIEGSPQNSLSAVVPEAWVTENGVQMPDLSAMIPKPD